MTITETTTISNLVVLQTSGYHLNFYLSSSENPINSFFDAEVEFSVRPELLQRVSVKSEKIKISFDDLRRLINYLRNHMQSLQLDANHESYVFTDYNLAYQIQAFCGYISSNIEESNFSVISMVNIGKRTSLSNSIYVGGESTTRFNQVETFVTSLENIMSG